MLSVGLECIFIDCIFFSCYKVIQVAKISRMTRIFLHLNMAINASMKGGVEYKKGFEMGIGKIFYD